MERLEQAQWQTPQVIEAQQLNMLRLLLSHHARHSPWVQQRIQSCALSAEALSASLAAWSAFPVMTRRDLQQMDGIAHHVPTSHEPVMEKKSSGSTGEPVTVRRTAVSALFSQAHTLRDHLWHQRDPAGTLFAVRSRLTQAVHGKSWGAPVADLFETGPAYGVPIGADVGQLLAWLQQVQPHYLLIYPSIWRSVLDASKGMHGLWRNLKQVRTLGETVDDTLRVRTQAETPASLVDLYSAEELGTIALQCPHSGLYHVMSENLLIEVLDPHGNPCQPGETGRVVVTDLTNLATPLLRYANGDYAVMGAPCACGRGLPTLQRILGRERNMVLLPDGHQHWPDTGREFGNAVDIRQYQIIQKTRHEVEIRLVVPDGRLSTTQEAAISEMATRWLGHPFRYHFTCFAEEIPRHPSGKFEEFICEASRSSAGI